MCYVAVCEYKVVVLMKLTLLVVTVVVVLPSSDPSLHSLPLLLSSFFPLSLRPILDG